MPSCDHVNRQFHAPATLNMLRVSDFTYVAT